MIFDCLGFVSIPFNGSGVLLGILVVPAIFQEHKTKRRYMC